jgi:hypothetical protein
MAVMNPDTLIAQVREIIGDEALTTSQRILKVRELINRPEGTPHHDGKVFRHLPGDKFEEWCQKFRGLKVEVEIGKAERYLALNPKKRPKPGRGTIAFVTNWLKNAVVFQQRGKAPQTSAGRRDPVDVPRL